MDRSLAKRVRVRLFIRKIESVITTATEEPGLSVY